MTHTTLDHLVLRERDLQFVFSCLARGESGSLVGLSNMGKSSLLRALPALSPDVVERWFARDGAQGSRAPLFVYVDCNLMLELTGQGFYEAILRALLEALTDLPASRELVARVRACYERVTGGGQNPFQVSLNFNEGVAATAEGLDRMMVLLLDEFDEAFAALDGRVFLNLRALDDKYGDRMAYITATIKPLREIRTDIDTGAGSQVDEFCELFVQHAHYLGPLDEGETRRLVAALAARKGVALAGEDIDFVLGQSGGHPGLIQATVQALIEAGPNAPSVQRADHFTLLESTLDDHENVRRECAKLWTQLGEDLQEAAVRFLSGGVEAAGRHNVQGLLERGVLVGGPSLRSGQGVDEPRIPGRLLREFVRRQRRIRQDVPAGVWIDVEAGDVWVERRQVPALTDLEYRLLLLLYGRIDKICDKYAIVENVWGQEYIDEVDDARIEKLISRLRSKIETDAANPRYLMTMRGRGYKLVQG